VPKQYLVNFLVKGFSEPVEFEVREHDWSRIQNLFEQGLFLDETRFVVFDSLDGRSVGINISDVQCVRYLWNPVELPADLRHNNDPVTVWIRDRAVPVTARADQSDALSAFFLSLESGASYVPFPSFEDEDGELFQVSALEVVMATAPTHEINEGLRSMLEEDESIQF
jgi:hypothetical protein